MSIETSRALDHNTAGL